jgi:aryl-alcohol dehydrogenase
MKIWAAVLREPAAPYRIEEVDLAEPGPGEIRVRIAGTGLCHTDLLPRLPQFPAKPPVILGHEGSGLVEVVGPGVTGLEAGDPVVLSYDSCGSCTNCLSAQNAYCETFMPRNLTGVGLGGPERVRDTDGNPVAARWFGQSSFATHCLVSGHNVVKVDRDLPLELLGPLGCGVQTGAGAVLISLGVDAGASLVVFGAGTVGLSAVMAARLAGAGVIVAVDLNPARLVEAQRFGATHTFDGGQENLSAALREVTAGGAQFTLDTTGVPTVIDTAIRALRPTGTCGLVGAQRGPVVLDPTALADGRTVTGILEGGAVPRVFIPTLLKLWRQGRFPFDQLIKTFPFDQINEAEQAAVGGKVVKPVLVSSN